MSDPLTEAIDDYWGSVDLDDDAVGEVLEQVETPLIDMLERLHKAPKREFDVHDDGTITMRHADNCPCWMCNDRPHPRVQELHENHRRKHDHGDTTPSCRSCNLYLSAEAGQNRVLCPRCSTPNFFTWGGE